MIGVLIATHGKFAEGILDSLELIMGKQGNCETLALYHDTSIEMFSSEMIEKIERLNQGNGVIIVTDLYSATPYNQAALNSKNLSHIPYKVLSGVNLPMLVEIFNQRMLDTPIEKIVTESMITAKEGVKEFFTELKKNNHI